MNTQLLEQAKVLAIDEQIELVEALWDGIVSRNAVPPLKEAQKPNASLEGLSDSLRPCGCGGPFSCRWGCRKTPKRHRNQA